jgi:hypothetical protein
MGKYTTVKSLVYSIFASAEWKAEAIETFPENFTGTSVGNEYIRVIILTSGETPVNSTRSVAGQLMIDIFVPAGVGSDRATQIADKLDKYLAGQSRNSAPNGNVQFGTSTMSSIGNDTANVNLYRFLYSLSFNYFGV